MQFDGLLNLEKWQIQSKKKLTRFESRFLTQLDCNEIFLNRWGWTLPINGKYFKINFKISSLALSSLQHILFATLRFFRFKRNCHPNISCRQNKHIPIPDRVDKIKRGNDISKIIVLNKISNFSHSFFMFYCTENRHYNSNMAVMRISKMYSIYLYEIYTIQF